jgi:aryl-alcohol dehydrogenase-like predicted oxidoreductase
MAFDRYFTLGRSGLRVSRLALGTMTFGTDGMFGAWGSEEAAARAVFDAYVGAGGNFIDTADFYTKGTSESLLGKFIAESGNRHRLVVTTKYSNSVDSGDPNAGGNGRKHMVRALDDSLRRLRMDYVDLFLVHTWDRITPPEEVVRGLDDLVRAGKIRYAGLSDVPSWYAARAQTWAEAHALTPLVSLQLPYSLVERSLEQEHAPMAANLGMGITAWSPLGAGLLSGKYRPSEGAVAGVGRLTSQTGSRLDLFSERNWAIVGALEGVAKELGRSMAQVALNWVATQPAVGAAIIGATKVTQLEDNLRALDFEIPPVLRTKLTEVSAPPMTLPYGMFTDGYQAAFLHVGATVGDKPRGYWSPIGG